MLRHGNPNPANSNASGSPDNEAAEWYERGIAVRKTGLFQEAIAHFEKATNDSAYALKAFAQIGLCYKSSRRHDEAVTAFRHALRSPAASTKEIVQILYVLGRTLESLGRVNEALESYRWLRREDSEFRDVTERIESLSERRRSDHRRHHERNNVWTRPATQVLQGFLRNQK